MPLLKELCILTLIMMTCGCGANSKVVTENYKKNYSIEVIGESDVTISDGLPEGIKANNVSSYISNNVTADLANLGLTKNNNKNKFKVKYTITYLAHKWKGGIRPKYILGYSVQLIDESNGNVIASDKNDKDNSELLKVIEDVSDNIVNFTIDKIDKSTRQSTL